MRAYLIPLGLLLVSPAAGAQTIYTWTDETGTVNFTDNLSTVPQGVQVGTTEGDELSVVESEKTRGDVGPQPAQAQPQARTQAGVEVAMAPASRSVARSVLTGDELDEREWRGQFKAARRAVETLEDEIKVDQRRLEDPSGVAINYTCGANLLGSPMYYAGPQQHAGVEVGVGVQPVPGLTLTGSGRLSTGTVAPPVRSNPQYIGSPCWVNPSPEFDRIRERLERNTAALKRARQDLDELDRQASFHGVPREWRR